MVPCLMLGGYDPHDPSWPHVSWIPPNSQVWSSFPQEKWEWCRPPHVLFAGCGCMRQAVSWAGTNDKSVMSLVEIWMESTRNSWIWVWEPRIFSIESIDCEDLMIWFLLGVNGTMEPVPICWLIQKLPASVTGFCNATPRTKRVTPIDSVLCRFLKHAESQCHLQGQKVVTCRSRKWKDMERHVFICFPQKRSRSCTASSDQIWPNFASCRPCCRQLAGLKSAEEILDFCARPRALIFCRPWWGSVGGSMRAILVSTSVGRKH